MVTSGGNLSVSVTKSNATECMEPLLGVFTAVQSVG
jgi:hypothetical protein